MGFLPPVLPWLRAYSRPRWVRSRIIARSNSAKLPSIRMSIRSAGLTFSMCSVRVSSLSGTLGRATGPTLPRPSAAYTADSCGRSDPVGSGSPPTPTALARPPGVALPRADCRRRPLAPTQRIPVRCSWRPRWTVSRPQPNTRSAWRALPPHYFSVIAAWKERRSAPDSIELANLRSSIWEACNGKAVGSIADGMAVLGDQSGRDILPQWGNCFSEMT